jgi:hypothetical protein
MTCAPTATRTRDLPLRRSSRGYAVLSVSWFELDFLSPGYYSMSVVYASFWHVADTA